MSTQDAGNSWTPPSLPLRRDGSDIIDANGRIVGNGKFANEAQWLCDTLNGHATAPVSAGEREALSALIKLHSFFDFAIACAERESITFDDPSGINDAFAEAMDVIEKSRETPQPVAAPPAGGLSEREAFEKMAIGRGVGVTIQRGPDGEYIDRYIWAMWIAWQAARTPQGLTGEER